MLKERRGLYDPSLMIMAVPSVIACEIEAGLGGKELSSRGQLPSP
jgi:hypothetical protein